MTVDEDKFKFVIIINYNTRNTYYRSQLISFQILVKFLMKILSNII